MVTLSFEHNYIIKVWHIGLQEYFAHAISDSYTEAAQWAKGLHPKAAVFDGKGNLLETFIYQHSMTCDELENKYWEAIEAGEKAYQDTEGDLTVAIIAALKFYISNAKATA